MEDKSEPRERRVLTPAVLASALFVAACATFAVSFVAARGGLHLAGGATPPPVAVATTEPTVLASPEPLPSPAQTVSPTVAPTVEPSAVPTVEPSAAPTTAPAF